MQSKTGGLELRKSVEKLHVRDKVDEVSCQEARSQESSLRPLYAWWQKEEEIMLVDQCRRTPGVGEGLRQPASARRVGLVRISRLPCILQCFGSRIPSSPMSASSRVHQAASSGEGSEVHLTARGSCLGDGDCCSEFSDHPCSLPHSAEYCPAHHHVTGDSAASEP